MAMQNAKLSQPGAVPLPGNFGSTVDVVYFVYHVM